MCCNDFLHKNTYTLSNSHLHAGIDLYTHTHITTRGQRATGFSRPIGCPTLQVSFRKKATNFSAFWRKIIYKDKTPYTSSPPCTSLWQYRGLDSPHTHTRTQINIKQSLSNPHLHACIHTDTHIHITSLGRRTSLWLMYNRHYSMYTHTHTNM